MANETQVLVPDIGDFDEVDVIDILVAPGASVATEDPLVTLESDKATMDIPAPAAGIVERLGVKLGDKVSEGDLVLVLKLGADTTAETSAAVDAPAPSSAPAAPDRQPHAEDATPAATPARPPRRRPSST